LQHATRSRKQTDALFAINMLKNLYARLPFSLKSSDGNVQLMLLKKLPDAYQWKRVQIDKYYEGDNKGVPTWENQELIKNYCHWLKPDETRPVMYTVEARNFAQAPPVRGFVAEANAAAARRPLPPGYVPKARCLICAKESCYVAVCPAKCPTCGEKLCPGAFNSKPCVVHATAKPVAANVTNALGRVVSDRTFTHLLEQWTKWQKGRPRAHAATATNVDGWAQEEMLEMEHDLSASSAERHAEEDIKWYNLLCRAMRRGCVGCRLRGRLLRRARRRGRTGRRGERI